MENVVMVKKFRDGLSTLIVDTNLLSHPKVAELFNIANEAIFNLYYEGAINESDKLKKRLDALKIE